MQDYRVIRTKQLLRSPEAKQKSEAFREKIFQWHGFQNSAREFIRENSAVIVLDFRSTAGGGFWWPPNFSTFSKLVQLLTAQHEGAVHECSHVWWHFHRAKNQAQKEGLCRDTVKLADMDPKEHPEIKEAINFARGYVYGIGDWIGMYGNADYKNNPENLPEDLHGLTKEDFEKRVNDWEIFAGFCSFTMGKFKDGPRQLPEFMWQYFERLFTGKLSVVPYYMMGGHP